jgi:hypothetical protein
VKEELSVIIPGVSKAVDLNPGNQDSGVFLFDEDAQEIPEDQTPLMGPTTTPVAETRPVHFAEPIQSSTNGAETEEKTSLLDVHEPSPHPQSPALVLKEPLVQDHVGAGEKIGSQPVQKEEVAPHIESPQSETQPPRESSFAVESNREETATVFRARKVSLVPNQSGAILTLEKRGSPAALRMMKTNMRDRDSGVYLSDNESSPAQSRPSSIASNGNAPLRSRVTSLSTPSPQRTNSITRLQRPAELNLGFGSAQDSAKPKSELDKRSDLFRNSKTQSKAALRSPTQLLQDRLGSSTKKTDTMDTEGKVRVFTPPRATVNGCVLPGPGAQAEAFTSTSVRARTEAGGRPAWWCKFDKLVVFDGIEQVDGESRLRTRTSKGLTIARRRGDLETVVIPLDCDHCHEMLNRHEWKYDMRVCKRSVCWDCKERCKWELEQDKMTTAATPRTDANRERADSVLQEEQDRSHEHRKEIIA